VSKSKNFQFIDVKEWKPGETIELPDFIKKAIRCAPMDRVNIRNWRPLETDELTNAEKAMRLIETKFFVPSGNYVGRPALAQPHLLR
jgi:hypothetical protein